MLHLISCNSVYVRCRLPAPHIMIPKMWKWNTIFLHIVYHFRWFTFCFLLNYFSVWYLSFVMGAQWEICSANICNSIPLLHKLTSFVMCHLCRKINSEENKNAIPSSYFLCSPEPSVHPPEHILTGPHHHQGLRDAADIYGWIWQPPGETSSSTHKHTQAFVLNPDPGGTPAFSSVEWAWWFLRLARHN